MKTLWEIRQEYVDLNREGLEDREFGQYLTEEYIHVYDNELNFVGWEKDKDVINN